MCIDAQMLSAYLDGELAEPYRTQVKEHLEHCPACRHHLEDMREIGDRIRSTEYPSQMLDRNKDRILSVLDAKYFQNGRKVGFFRRRLEVSLPSLVTAAAAVVFIFIGSFMFFGTSDEQTGEILPSFAVQAGNGSVRYVSDAASLDNFTLEEILHYLDSKGYNVDISIKGLKPLDTSIPAAESAE